MLEGRNISLRYRQFKGNEYKSFEVLREYQFDRLKELFRHAYDSVPYYRDKFTKIGFHPEDLTIPDDIKKIPVLTKTELKENFDSLISSDFNHRELIEYATGGSTGEPVKFLLTKEQYDTRAAVSFKSYQMTGWDFLDKTILLTGAPIDIGKYGSIKSKIKSYLLRQTVISSFNLKEKDLSHLYHIIQRNKPKAIFGYVSALSLFAEYLAANNLYVNIPIIIQMAELVLPEQVRLIEERLGGRFYKHYGARDAIAMGIECSKRQGLHANMDTLWIEILKDNKEVCDEDGEVIVTDLYSFGMPLIRYQIGDVGHWLKNRCSCGRHTPLFEITQGRVSNIITTPDGKYVTGLFIPHLFKEKAEKIEKYQVYEPDLKHLVVRIVKKGGYTNTDEEFLREKLREKLGTQMDIEFQYLDDISPSPSGKYLFVKSDVPVNFGNVN